MFFAFTVVVNG